jgi:hypothetical protein
MLETSELEVAEKERTEDLEVLDLTDVPSPVLARLIEEVRNEKDQTVNAYNRMHNRHNRSR